jgi:carbamoyltransferase
VSPKRLGRSLVTENQSGSLDWDHAVAICADGGSENGCTGVYLFTGAHYEPIADLDNTILTGRFYGAITQLILGGSDHEAHVQWPGKTMGLSAFGRYDENLASLIIEHRAELNRLHSASRLDLAKKLGLGSNPDPFDWRRWDLAHTAQRLWEETWLEQLSRYCHLSENLIFSGGCALNCLLNSKMRRHGLFTQIFIPPTPGDDGQALGALIHQLGAKCCFPFLGRCWGHADDLPEQAVDDLVAGKILLWFDGRSEIGPRALGHRSIFASADTVARRRKISERVKAREWYRPVAPIVLAERASDWFEIQQDSPWMLEAVPAKQKTRIQAPAVVHVDGSSRVQTLRSKDDPLLHDLLTHIEATTGVPILVNTSMNLPGDPICDSPDDAKHTLVQNGADVLYIAGKRFTRDTLQ